LRAKAPTEKDATGHFSVACSGASLAGTAGGSQHEDSTCCVTKTLPTPSLCARLRRTFARLRNARSHISFPQLLLLDSCQVADCKGRSRPPTPPRREPGKPKSLLHTNAQEEAGPGIFGCGYEISLAWLSMQQAVLSIVSTVTRGSTSAPRSTAGQFLLC